MVRAWHHTFQLPALTTHCSNNYGPCQYPEKLIPLTIDKALNGQPLPVYGDGLQVRDWLYVDDHCAALRAVLERGAPGETYNIGGRAERTNISVVRAICAALDESAAAAGRPQLRRADQPCDRQARPRSPLRDRRQQDRARTGMEAVAGVRGGLAADRAVVPRQW